jgi:hypothetical protein
MSDKYVEDAYLDGGSTARPEFTTPKEQPMSLSWPAMTNADVATVWAFIASVRTDVFQWTDLSTNTDYVARFVSDPFSYAPLSGFPGYNSATLRMLVTDVIADSVDDGIITDAVDSIEDDGTI